MSEYTAGVATPQNLSAAQFGGGGDIIAATNAIVGEIKKRTPTWAGKPTNPDQAPEGDGAQQQYGEQPSASWPSPSAYNAHSLTFTNQ